MDNTNYVIEIANDDYSILDNANYINEISNDVTILENINYEAALPIEQVIYFACIMHISSVIKRLIKYFFLNRIMMMFLKKVLLWENHPNSQQKVIRYK